MTATLKMEREGMEHEKEREYVLEFADRELVGEFQEYAEQQRRMVDEELENWWNKYQNSLEQSEGWQEKAESDLNDFLKELGYE